MATKKQTREDMAKLVPDAPVQEQPAMSEQEQAAAQFVQLIQNTLNIIDIAAKRGTFGGDELMAVGSTRNALAEIIQARQ